MSEHTPTPWHVNGWDVVAQPSIKWHVVATTARLEYDDKDRERDANAAYIVECVNSHDALSATCAKLRSALVLASEAMEHMGNVMNDMDIVEDEDITKTTAAFAAVREALKESAT